MAQTPLWSDDRDDDHPVRWTSADGIDVRWTTLDNAVDRLVGYGHDRDTARSLLLGGRQLQTSFAYYLGTSTESD